MEKPIKKNTSHETNSHIRWLSRPTNWAWKHAIPGDIQRPISRSATSDK